MPNFSSMIAYLHYIFSYTSVKTRASMNFDLIYVQSLSEKIDLNFTVNLLIYLEVLANSISSENFKLIKLILLRLSYETKVYFIILFLRNQRMIRKFSPLYT